jgi:hypothetical protein
MTTTLMIEELDSKMEYDLVTRMRLRRIHRPYEYGNGARLDAIVQEIKLRVRITKKEIYHIGELLTEAKEIVGHGHF